MKNLFFSIIFLSGFSERSLAQNDSVILVDQKMDLQDSFLVIGPSFTLTDSFFKNYHPEIGCIVPQRLEFYPQINFTDTKFTSSISFIISSNYNQEGAKTDIQEGKPRILFHGGFGGMPNFDSEQDREFQHKYHVDFFSQGCLKSGENEDEEAYNKVIFAYLDKKHGTKWRLELRDDAIGFDTPKTNTLEFNPINNLPIAIQLPNTGNTSNEAFQTPESENSVWWYIMPTSGFALLLALYFIKRKKD
jgi:hypothetical protein